MDASHNTPRLIKIVLFAIALLVAILAGIGTGDSFETAGSFWEPPDTTTVHADR